MNKSTGNEVAVMSSTESDNASHIYVAKGSIVMNDTLNEEEARDCRMGMHSE